jgi:NAD-dependent deacetylase
MRLRYFAITGRLTLFHDESLADSVESLPTPWDKVDESDLDASLLRIFNIRGKPELDVSFKPHVLLFDEYYTELYRISEAQRRMLAADRMVFMGTSFSVNITMMALDIARVRNTPVEIVDPEPVEIPHADTTYHAMTALEYVTRIAGD